jgi:general stress protein YciG
MTQNSEDKPKPRGFAAMTPERRREIAQMGGRAVQAKGTGHRYSAEEARAAGKKGGAKTGSDSEHMSRIGRLGGLQTKEGKSVDE